MPITWQSLVAPNLVGASNMMQNVQYNFDSAIEGMRNELAARRELQSQNVDTLRENNKQQFLDYLSGFRTPAELAAAQASGAVDQQVAGFGGVIDRAAVRGAADRQLATLRDQTRAANEFGDMERDRTEAPLIAEGMQIALRGDEKGIQEFLTKNDIRNESNVAKTLYDALYGRNSETRAQAQDRRADITTNLAVDRDQRQAELHGFEVNAAKQREADENARRELGALARNEATNFIQQRQEIQDKQDQLWREMGLPVTADGRPDRGVVEDPAQIDRYQQAVEEIGLGQSSTQFVNEIRARIAQDPRYANVNPDLLEAPVSYLDQRLADSNNISALAQEEMAMEQAALDRGIEGNSYVGYEKENRANLPAELLAPYQFKDKETGETAPFGETDNEETAAITRTVTRLAKDGVTFDTGAGKVTVPVPRGLLEAALQSVSTGGIFDGERDIEAQVITMMKDNPGFLEDWQNYNQYQNASRSLQGRTLREQNSYADPKAFREDMAAFRQRAAQAQEQRQAAEALARKQAEFERLTKNLDAQAYNRGSFLSRKVKAEKLYRQKYGVEMPSAFDYGRNPNAYPAPPVIPKTFKELENL